MSNVHMFPKYVSGSLPQRCPKGHFVPDGALACRECIAEKSEEAMQGQQAEYLRKARDREWNYTLRVARGPERHALMYSPEARTFCGRLLKTRPQVEHMSYDERTLASLCPACRAAIASALQIMDRPEGMP